RLPSGPPVILAGLLPAVMPPENSVTVPAGVIRPTRAPLNSVNQRLPSGPAVMPRGALAAVMPAGHSVTGAKFVTVNALVAVVAAGASPDGVLRCLTLTVAL